VNVGEAFSWAWNKFSKNAAPLIVATLIYGVVVGVLEGIIYTLALLLAPAPVSYYDSSGSGFSASYSAGFGFASFAVLALGGLVVFVVGGAIQSAYLGALLDIANGEQVAIGSFFKPRNVGSVLLGSLIVGVLVLIGYLLCLLPGVAVAIFTIFTTIFIVCHCCMASGTFSDPRFTKLRLPLVNVHKTRLSSLPLKRTAR